MEDVSMTQEGAAEATVAQSGDATKAKRARKRNIDQLDVIDPAELENGRAAKRKAATPTGDVKPPKARLSLSLDEQTPANIAAIGVQIWEAVRDFEHEGRVLSPIFMELPSKKLYPDYYEMIKKPMAMDMIKAKLDKAEYTNLDAVKEDFNQMFTNARKYNQPSSVVYEDARKLHKLIRTQFNQAIEGDDADEEGKLKKKKKIPTLKGWLQKKLEEVTYFQDVNGRYLSEIFMSLPDRAAYPDYYEVIPHPICFDTVQDKIKRRAYPSEKPFVQDVNGIFANAKYYNEEKSQVWKDATHLQRVFADIMREPPPDFATLAAGPEKVEEAPKLKIRLGGDNADGSGSKITLTMGSAPTLPPAPETRAKREEEADVTMSPGALADISTLEVPAPRQVAFPAPATARKASPAPVLPPAGPRIYRDRAVALTDGHPALSTMIVRCQPNGPVVELSMAKIRQHVVVLPRAVEMVEMINVGQEGANFAFKARPPSPQVLTVLEVFARANAGSKEEVYRVFLQRLQV